jgi:predicted nucleic acid-binding protein
MAVNAIAKEREFDKLCNDFEVGEMNTFAWLEAARLYALCKQNGRVIEDADLFIAAFCIVNDYTLVTNNTKHFDDIHELRLVNWID